MAAAVGATWVRSASSHHLPWLFLILGLLAFAAAPRRRDGKWRAVLWFAAGLALVGGRALVAADERRELARLLSADPAVALRVEATISDGWSASRWGLRSSVVVHRAEHNGDELRLPRRCAMELRGDVTGFTPPPPGSRIAALLGLRGEAERPLLVASSPMLLQQTAPPSGIAAARDHVVTALYAAAGTRPARIQAAQLAAALAVGRRDAIPAARREAWRRSGFAHLLAVSGLHVGLVAGATWLLAVALGCRPTWARLAVLAVLPGYAILSGASPSAVRAAIMGMVYLLARLAGRPLEPMAAVLLTSAAMLAHQPELIGAVGFQLTVVVTAALVRWAPPVAAAIRGPRWLAAAIAVPLVAQLAAAPIVAWHFRNVVPGSLAANLLVLPLLTPLLAGSLLTAVVAPLWPAAATLLLDLLHPIHVLLWWCGSAGRSAQLITPPLPTLVAIALAAAAWLALQPGARARNAALCWLALLLATAGWWALRPAPCGPSVTLLPVAEGAAVVIRADGPTTVLLDGGKRRREAAELLAEMGVSRLDAVIASHSDEDHIAGLAAVIESCQVRRLLIPRWMLADDRAQELIRAARSNGVRTVPAARGSLLSLPGMELRTLWPPPGAAILDNNDRSLVLHVTLSGGRVLLTGDAGSSVERRLVRSSWLRSDILVVGHHGSTRSTTGAFLAACAPRLALIPAGPGNTHHHPSPVVLERLVRRRIMHRAPISDGWCGAAFSDDHWRPFP